MRNISLLLSLGILATALSVWSADVPKSPATKTTMALFLNELTALKKYMVSDAKFEDPKNSDDIAKHLKEFARLAKSAAHDPTLKQENFKFSRQVLEERIVDTERVFRLGRKSYARWQLASTASICMSCHTQLPGSDRLFGNFNDTSMFTSAYDRAEFLFSTRAFDKALQSYDEVIAKFPKNEASVFQVEKSLEREVAYYSRLKRNPTEAIAKLELHLARKNLPDYLVMNIKSWIQQFTKWTKVPILDPRTASDEQIVKFAKDNIEVKTSNSPVATNPNLVTYLKVSGVLFEYLETHPHTKATPQVLYWLSVCERSIESSFFYSLADMYLRECITKFPADPIAKKCYQQYELETTLGYTGSGGVRIPLEVRDDLNTLKQLVESKGKVQLHEQ